MGSRKKTDAAVADYLAGREPDEKRPGFIRRHKVLFIAVLTLFAIVVASGFAFALVLNNSLGNIKKVPVNIAEEKRPAASDNKALNILMLGADAGTKRNGAGSSILKDAASDKWPTGKYRSDTTMLVHITEDRKKAYVISIPRDSYVKVYDSTGEPRDDTKINAALSLYGPAGALSTVENFSDLRIDHLAMVDWDGFEGITNALGGVNVTIKGQGEVSLKGESALDYVRVRKTLPNGDFDRVKRQQNFLRALMSKMVERGTLTNPIKLTNTTKAVTKNLAVDEGWSNGDIRSLAFSMRGIRPSNVTFMTIPTKGTDNDPIAGSIVVVDKGKSAKLFDALQNDEMTQFLKDNGDLRLGSQTDVN